MTVRCVRVSYVNIKGPGEEDGETRRRTTLRSVYQHDPLLHLNLHFTPSHVQVYCNTDMTPLLVANLFKTLLSICDVFMA